MRMRRLMGLWALGVAWLAVTLVSALLVLPGASASIQVGVAEPGRVTVAPQPKGKTLQVTVGALPSGKGTVEVRGPNGFRKTLRKSTTLKRLTPGRYRIAAATVSTKRFLAKPKVSKRKVRVTNKRGALVEVSYPVAVSTDLEVVKPAEVKSFVPPRDGAGKLVSTEELTRGDIVAAGVGPVTPEGMLVKVTDVVDSGRQSTYTVTQARIDEAVPQGSFDTTMTADLTPPTSARVSARGRVASRAGLGCTVGGGDPSISPEGGIAMQMSGSWGAGTPSVTVTVTPYAQAKIKAFIGAQAACKKEISIFDRKFAPITVMIGPVPFVVVPRLRMLAGADLSVNAGLSVDASARIDATLAATASGSAFQTHVTGPTVTRSATVEMQGNASADLYARARFTGDIYGVGGPYGQVRVGVKGQADVAANPWWKLEAYAQAGVGVEIEKCTQVFVTKLCLSLSAGKDDLINKTYPITNAGGPFGTSPTATPTPTATPNPTPTPTPNPTPTPGQAQWSSLTAGGSFSCGIKTDATAWCWGNGSMGQLGIGTTTVRSTPTQVPGSWSSLDAGGAHACGVKTDGTGWCWGGNESGQVGDGTVSIRWSPVQLSGAWSSMTAGGAYSCGVKNDDSAWCWGANTSGQLGDGTMTSRSIPAQVSGSWGNLTAGVSHSCGVKTDGTAWCWGSNGSGQLGDGSLTADRPLPTQVLGSWSELAAGNLFSCGVRTDGTGWCWGSNASGQLGDGTTITRPSPTQIPGSWSGLAAGFAHACGVMTDGTGGCGGNNSSGEVGDGTTVTRYGPTPLPDSWSNLTAGWQHSCGIKTDGTAWCWGSNGSGQLGDGTTTARMTPTPVSGA